MRTRVVTIFGSSTPEPLSPPYQDAYELGRALAQAGWTVCNGGYGGTMEAAARGAREVGGHTIGVTCSIFGRRGGANRYIQQEVPTFDLHARLNTLVRLAHAYVVLPGGTGTLLELALVWELYSKGLTRRAAPLILFGTHWTPLIGILRAQQDELLEPFVASSAADVVEFLRHEWATAPDADDAPSPTP